MSTKLCPFCMRMTEHETCPHCGKNINYAGASAHLPAGYVVSGKHPYVLGAALGQGGFGITYIALDMVTKERVAIKEYFPAYCSGRTGDNSVSAYQNQEDIYQKGKERFLDEARTLKSLSDLKSIVDVLDFFEANNSAYLVMEYLDGSSLKEHAAKNGKFPAQKFLNQVRPLMEDLEKMHQRGVIHRDIAPDNIILLPDGQLKLIDFGAARSYVGDKSMTVVVKKGFAPVEQYMSKGSSSSTDVYALAATIYYCITGRVPPDSAERQYDGTPLVSPSSLDADITPLQEKALIKALEIHQKARTQSIQDFLDNLSAKASRRETAKPAKRRQKQPAPAPKKRIFGVLAATVALLAVAFFLFAKPMLQKPEPLPTETSAASADTWEANLLYLANEWNRDRVARTSATEPVYGSDIPRSKITSVTFLDTVTEAPASCWDMSAKKDRSVLAWVTERGGRYDLFIAGEGGINAGTSTRELFSSFANLEAVHNLRHLHTDYVTDMRSMFYGCGSLREISFAENDLSNVQRMEELFLHCRSLSSCDFSQTDLSGAIHMDNMFSECSGLQAVSFAGLDLSGVENMPRMFNNCSHLSSCDFSQAVFSNVSHLSDMFSGCSNLVTVKYGNSQNYHPEDFVNMLKDPGYAAVPVPENATPVSVIPAGSTQTILADNLEVHVTDKRDITVTLAGLDLEDTYLTNLKSSGLNDLEYGWKCYLYGPETYLVSTAAWAFSPGNQKEKTLDGMQHSLFVHVEEDGKEYFSRICDVTMTHTKDSITWTFRMPDQYAFNISQLQSLKTTVENAPDNFRSETTYVVTAGQ